MFVDIENGVDIIGDIHGCYEEWMEMLEKLGYRENTDGYFVHPEGRKIVSLGDVMSRGPYSIQTMDFFLKHVNKQFAYMVDSNHGWKIARWLDGRNVQLKHGDELVEEEFQLYEKEYGKEKTIQLKQQLRDLLMEAPSHLILRENAIPKVVCVHAGIKDEYIGKESKKIQNFCRYGDVAGMGKDGKPIRRDWFQHRRGELLIIWGHDPKPEPLIVNHTINLDQGVVFGGKLTAYRYPEEKFVFVKARKTYAFKEGFS